MTIRGQNLAHSIEVVGISISFDGTWSSHGWTASRDIVTAIAEISSQVIDVSFKFFILIFFNWDSLHAKLNSHCEAWSYKKRHTKKITGYRKSV